MIYRVYFSGDQGAYHVVEAQNAHTAVRRAKRLHHALRINKLRRIRLDVAKIERLEINGIHTLKRFPK